jgi:hypothetical protein
MRVIVPFLSAIAAMVTIAAGVVRIRWAWVQQRVHDTQHVGREALPGWVKPVATFWLVAVGLTVTGVFLYVVVVTIVSLSA